MTTQTLTLTDFILARIAEDEAEARHRDVVTFGPEQRAVAGVQGAFDPARVLAECEAKRRIVRDVEAYLEIPAQARSEILAALALPYADHRDYRDEWRP